MARITASDEAFISIPEMLTEHPNVAISAGRWSTVKIGANPRIQFLSIEAGENCHVFIGDDCYIGSLVVICHNGGRVAVGDNVHFSQSAALFAHESFSLSIGSDCSIANNAMITISDMHPIFDARTGARINRGADVSIGRRVWVGDAVHILKGSVIGDGAVIGAATVVTGTIPANCIAVGNPARVIRKRIRWERDGVAT